MWVEQLPNGKYRMAERYTDPMTGKKKKVSVTMDRNTAATRRTAGKLLEEKMEKEPTAMVTTFEDLVRKWRVYQEATVKQSTYKRNYHSSNALLRIIGPDILVENLTAGYIMERFLATKNKPGTINEHLRRLKAIIRWGYKADYIKDISYLEKLKPMKDDERKRKLADKYMEADEVNTLIEAMKVEKWRDLTQFLVLTGMRCGEAFALSDSDIDLKERQIHVTKTLDVVNDLITPPKTSNSIRDIFIQDELMELAKKLRNETLLGRLSGGDGRIFYSGRYAYYAYEKYFKTHTQEVLGRKLTVHCLRHTHVALLAENGMPLDMIGRRLGHSDSRITRDVYFHVTKKLQEKENQMLRKISIL